MPDFIESFVHWVFWLAITFIVVQHVLGPILVWRSERIPAAYDLPPIDIQSVITALDQGDALAVEQLATLGYAPVAASLIVKSHTLTSFVLFRSAIDPAVANLTFATRGALKVSYVEFTQAFADGMMLDVNSTSMPRLYPAFADRHFYRFPGMPVPELHAAFSVIRAGLARERAPLPALSFEAPLSDLARWLNDETVKLVELGYLVRRPENGAHRLSAKGALLFTWKLIWPWKVLHNWKQISDARRALHAAR